MHEQAAFSMTIGIASRLDQVRLIRAALSGVLTHLQVAEQDIHALELAVTELVNNSFEHGYQGAEDQQISVALHLLGADLEICVIDNAPPFPEDQRYRLVDEPRPFADTDEEWTIRGNGLRIVRELVDSIDLEADGTGNRITVKKHVGLLEA